MTGGAAQQGVVCEKKAKQYVKGAASVEMQSAKRQQGLTAGLRRVGVACAPKHSTREQTTNFQRGGVGASAFKIDSCNDKSATFDVVQFHRVFKIRDEARDFARVSRGPVRASGHLVTA
jgi:hypothetical protein